MRIYIPGPPSTDQALTAKLLKERGYWVITSAMVASPKYYLNRDKTPSGQDLRTMQANELLMSDCAVITDELDAAYSLEVVSACRFMGVPVVRYEKLPLLAPGCGAVQHVLDGIDLGNPVEQPEEQTLTVTHVRAWLDRVWDRTNAAFELRFGWFFLNGNKVHRAPVQYRLETKPMTTA